MKLINLTPHEIVVIGGLWIDPDTGNQATSTRIPPSGEVARVSMVETPTGTLDGIPVVTTTPGPVQGLPDPQDGVALIVSALVRLAVPHRTDVFSPGNLIRDDQGKPVGCSGLVRNEG